jgi:hypothetical protein
LKQPAAERAGGADCLARQSDHRGPADLADFGLLNEIIGRSEWGQWAVGSLTMQDAIMLQR